MKKATANAIKTLLRMDASVTSEERMRIVAALSGEAPTAEIRLDGDLSVAEAAEYLSMSRTTLWRRCVGGEIESVRRGKKFYIPGEEVRRIKGTAA